MSKEDLIRITGVVEELLPSAMFRVILENGHPIIATISGRLRQNNIRILAGDNVDVEMSPYDLNRGRIVYRNKQSMRDIIELLEDTKKLELKKLPYAEGGLAPVMSRTTIENHYGKLAKGYVDRFNKGEGDPTFNEAGAYLHNIFFPQLRSPKNANVPYGASLALINRHFGNFNDFKKAFAEEAMKLQGSNWIYLSRSGQIKTIKNHAKRNDIALLVDWWEHAWVNDYGADKKKYLQNIWRIINWEAVNRRIYAGDRA